MITIFTPSYNRAYILPKLYKSLKEQTCFDFEWLIVDDGSTDNTESLVKTWQQETNPFVLRYISQKNGGKHTAINTGVNEAKGEAFFIVDSDDILPKQAIEFISEDFSYIDKDPHFAGICGVKANIKTKKPLSNSEQSKGKKCSMLDIRQKYGIKGDMAEVFKTDLLKQYPFPFFEGEKFMNEAMVWNKISEKYIFLYTGKIIYFCEYRPDGLTFSIRKHYRNSPQSTAYYYNSIFNSPIFGLKAKIRCALLYWRYLWLSKAGYKNADFWIFLFLPFGFLLYFYDIYKEKHIRNKRK